MPAIVVNQGLQFMLGILSGTVEAHTALQSLSVDDGTGAFAAGTTNLGSPTNLAVSNFDATPTLSGEVSTHTATFAAGEANFEIKRIALHNVVEGSVNGTSDTLFGGVYGHSLTKTPDFSMELVMTVAATNNS